MRWLGRSLAELARTFPATQIGLGPYTSKRDEIFAEWEDPRAGACPNVQIKLGGLGMRMFGFTHHTGELPPSLQELATVWRPYIETCIARFGPERAMFESNFPVDNGSCGYAALWNDISVPSAISDRGRSLHTPHGAGG